MLEKINAALRLFAFAMPGPVRDVLKEIGAELDRLRAEVDELRSERK